MLKVCGNPAMQLLLVFALISSSTFCQQPGNGISKDTSPVLISNQFSFTEGPAVDKQGNVFFTDQPNNKIWKYDTEGNLSVFLDSAGRSNGMYFDNSGNLVACADEKNQLWMITPERQITVLVNDFKGRRLNGPNDVWIDQEGGIYFTDPYYQRKYWERQFPDPGIGGEKLYYLSKGKKEPVVADSDLRKPNGITGIRGKYLFVSDIGSGTVFRYKQGKDGALTDRRPFVNDLADGMTLDEQGNLYLAGKGVSVYDSTGKKIRHFDVPSSWTANLCFGGKNKDILFITASESVYILRMNVHGID
jgi:gluconolactonase